MSVSQELRNTLKKRFGRQAVITIDDSLYTVADFKPTARNNRLFPVHKEAVERLNQTMERHIRGNAQIYVTMIYKDVPREELIAKFWNGMTKRPEFLGLPRKIQILEHEQATKLGPMSRFSEQKLFDGFISHIDESNKTVNRNIDEYAAAVPVLAKYFADSARIALEKDASLYKYIRNFYKLDFAFDNLNKDKSGGDPYFVRVDRQIAGVNANSLYLKAAVELQKSPHKSLFYEMFIRIQNKGNNIIPSDFEEALKEIKVPKSGDTWKPEKNRVVQGDSRAEQFLHKNMSDIFTKLCKEHESHLVGWRDQDTKNLIMGNTIKEFHGKYLFDSFDATEYDATTDPRNFELGIKLIYEICRNLGLDPDKLMPEADAINHYLTDPTITPWGTYKRLSTPSGHNFTGPAGTATNLLRVFVQTARLLDLSFTQLAELMRQYSNKNIALFSCVGDDAFQLRDLEATREGIAEENNYDGYTSNNDKILLDPDYIHFLQMAYYIDPKTNILLLGYYPASRMVQKALFQETANQYSSEEVSTQAIGQSLMNLRFNPLQEYTVEFLMEGDPKYRLGSKMGVMNLFKKAAGDRSVAEFLGREWDPEYSGMTWKEFGETFRSTAELIERVGKRLYGSERKDA